MSKIAFLVPSSSKNKTWSTYPDTYLHKHLLNSVFKTKDDNFDYVFYLGFDNTDTVYTSEKVLEDIIEECEQKKFSVHIKIYEDVNPGHLTKMWNMLFDMAYKDGCDYFIQCGDDIEFLDIGWVAGSVEILKSKNNLGMIGPSDVDYPRILTQTMVSRKHMEIFGYYFPEKIKNWYCDDWINFVYRNTELAHLHKGRCINHGGHHCTQRYQVVSTVDSFENLVQDGVDKIKAFIGD